MSTVIVSSDNSVVITTQEVTNIIAGPTEAPSVITTTSIGPQGLSAYQVAVQNGFVGTEQDYVESLQGNPRDLVVTKGIGELATLTVDFSNRLSVGQVISSVTSVVADPVLTITGISFTTTTISFTVTGGSLNSGHKLTMVVATTSPTSSITASIYLLNI